MIIIVIIIIVITLSLLSSLFLIKLLSVCRLHNITSRRFQFFSFYLFFSLYLSHPRSFVSFSVHFLLVPVSPLHSTSSVNESYDLEEWCMDHERSKLWESAFLFTLRFTCLPFLFLLFFVIEITFFVCGPIFYRDNHSCQAGVDEDR